MSMPPPGVPTGGQPINLSQLADELRAAGLSVNGLGMHDGYVYTFDDQGTPADFAGGDQQTVEATIAAHVGMRDVTDAEYAQEFQHPDTTPQRRQDIRDITAGLLPREQVPM